MKEKLQIIFSRKFQNQIRGKNIFIPSSLKLTEAIKLTVVEIKSRMSITFIATQTMEEALVRNVHLICIALYKV